MTAPNLTEEQIADFTNFLRIEQERSVDITLDERRAVALEFYQGQPFGDEVEGRSQAVTRDVSEVVDFMTVGILDTLIASGKIVEFETEPEIDEEAAQALAQQQSAPAPDGQPQAPQKPPTIDYGEQATAAVQYSFMRKQNGYLVLHTTAKAGLLEKLGVVKTYVEHQAPVHEERDALAGEIEVGDDGPHIGGSPVVEANATDEGWQPGMEAQNWRVKLAHPQPPKFCDAPVALEYFRVSPDAVTLDDAIYVGERVPKTLSDLVELGYDPEKLEELWSSAPPTSIVEQARDAERGQTRQSIGQRTGANKQLWLDEEYVLWDMDGDGIAERLFVHRIGQTILAVMPIAEQPYSAWSPFPMQHRLIGQSMADKTMDIQRIRSVLLRQALDSLYLSNSPRTLIDQASITVDTIDDLLTVRPGGLVRYRGTEPKPLQQIDTSATSFQGMEMMSSERESRTGVTRQSQGLNPDTMNKMLALDTLVPMADGTFKFLGDIVDGDRIIGGRMGTPVTVTKAHPVSDPERAYLIKFASGEEILAGGEHLWTVQTEDDRRNGWTWRTIDTDTLAKRMRKCSRNIYIPRVSQVEFEYKQMLPLDPYLFGVWLGDGHSWSPRITTMDAEIVDYMNHWCVDNSSILVVDKHQNSGRATTFSLKGGVFSATLSAMGVMKGDGEKHIPESYKRASYADRMELLRGLMDTDGCHHANAFVVFCQKEGRLLDDVVELIEGLGGWPKISRLKPEGRFPHKGAHFQVKFDLPDCPFRIRRKAERWYPSARNVTTQPIKSIEQVDIVPMRCLTVDDPEGLFCVGRRYTVTHNTASGLAMNMASSQQIELYVTRNFVELLVAPMFAKRYRLMRAYGKPFRMKIEGKYQTVDPSKWPDEIDMSINVGLGTGNKDQRLQYRMTLLDVQKQFALSGSRIVGEEQLYQNAKRLVSDSGLGVASDYFLDPSTLPPAEPPQDPEMAKVAAQQAHDQATLDSHHQQAMMKLQIQQEAQQADAAIKAQSAAQDLQTKQASADQAAQLAGAKALKEAQLADSKQNFEMDMAERQFLFDQEMAKKKHDHMVAQAKVSSDRPGGSLAQ